MNVLYIATYEGLSGASFSLLGMLDEIVKYDINPYVVMLKEGKLCNKLDEHGISYEIVRGYPWVISEAKINIKQFAFWLIKKRYNKRADNQIIKIIKEKDIDIVHINALTASVGFNAAKQCSIPCIWHIREFVEEDLGKRFWNKNKAMRMLGEVAKVIAISKSVKDKYSHLSPHADIEVVYNGVPDEYYISERKYNIFSDSNVKIVMAGRIDPGKGHEEVIKALAELILENKNRYKVHLLIVGESQDKSYEDALKKKVSDLGLERYISFWGFRDDISEIYKASDIAIIASKSEAFGRVTVEAMMAGTLVIGADTAATKELIQDKYGFLYRQGDSHSLKIVLEYVLNHQDNAITVASRARTYALTEFTTLKNAENIYHIYTKVLNKI